MILKSAIKKYLNRDVDDHRWLKDLNHKEIDALLATLRPKPKFSTELRLHQKVCFYLGVTYPQFSFWLDMGSGKTLLMLELIKYWFRFGDMKRALVFVLSDKAFPTWENQIKRFDINIPAIALEGSSREKWHQLSTFDRGIVLATYPGAVAMCSVKGIKRRGRKRKQGLSIDPNAVYDLIDGVGVFAMDESTKAGHSTSLIHEMCARISKRVECRYALAGRPFGRDPTMLFNQQLLIDHGETFLTKGLFQAAFFSREHNHFARSRFSYNYTFQKSKLPQLSRLMQHRSISYKAKECVDLPPVTRTVEHVKIGKDIRSYLQESLKALKHAKGNKQEIEKVFIRMRQITSGFLGYKDDETGEKAQIAFPTNPKLEKQLDLIEELPFDRKAVIFYEFTWSARQLIDALKQLKHKSIWLWAGTKNARAELDKFMNDKECRFAIIQNKVGAYSIDGLQEVANYGFVYESPVSVIDREQLEHRLIRQGQKQDKVFIYDLVVPNSVDERILEFHKEGESIMDILHRDPNRIFQ